MIDWALCNEFEENTVDSIERNLYDAHSSLHLTFLFLRFKAKNVNFVPVEIETISAVDDLKIAVLEILGDAFGERDRIRAIIIKKKNGVQFLLEDMVIKILTCAGEQAYDIRIVESSVQNDTHKDIEFLEV